MTLLIILIQLYSLYAIPITNEDDGLCGFIAATNIASLLGYTQWTCSTNGVPSSDVCGWKGIQCTGSSEVDYLSLNGVGLTGMVYRECRI